MNIGTRTVGAAVATLAAATLSLVAVAPAHAAPEDCVQLLNQAGHQGDYVTSACTEARTNPEQALATLLGHGVPPDLALSAIVLANA